MSINNSWKCSICSTQFIPKDGKYKCPKCGSAATTPLFKKEPELRKDKIVWKQVCHFQIKPKNDKEIHGRCALTGMGTSPASIGMFNIERIFYGPCNPEMCPIYQTWLWTKNTSENR